MAYTRRQELMCTEAQMIAKPTVVLRENEVIYIKMNDGTLRQKMGDGVTTIIKLPFTKVLDETLEPVQKLVKKAEEAAELAVSYNGKGAYGYAQDGGYTGTEEQFALKMATETFVTPQMFGAKGDGVTDDTEKMAVATTADKTVDLNGKSYVISDTITLHTIFQNGTLIYKGAVNNPVVSLKDGGGLVGVKIIIAVENYASSVVFVDYTAYTAQWNAMSFTIDGLHIDNTICTKFVDGSSCIKIVYDEWKVICGQNINEVIMDGLMDCGIHIEPLLRNDNDNPTFNTAIFSNVRFISCNTALKVYPCKVTEMRDENNQKTYDPVTGSKCVTREPDADTSNMSGGVGLMLLRFSNENHDLQVKPFLDLHNTTITGDMLIPWDYYGEYIPEQGTYRLHKSIINTNTGYFTAGNHNDSVRYGWYHNHNNGEHYTNRNVILPENIGNRAPLRLPDSAGNVTSWGVDTIKAVRFKPDGYNYFCLGFELTYNNVDDPTGKRAVQFGFDNAGKMLWRGYDPDSGTWGAIHPIYTDGAQPVSYNGKRPDGLRRGDYRFDTTYGKPIFWNNEKWVFADGLGIGEKAEVVTTIDIPESADLNEYKDAGSYGARASGTTNTLVNCPLRNTGILLEVNVVQGMPFQRLYGLVSGDIYTRRYTDSQGWSEWAHIPTQTEVQSMIDNKFNSIVNGNGVAY